MARCFPEQMEPILAEAEGIVKPYIAYSHRFLLRDPMLVRVCNSLDVDATMAPNSVSLTWPSRDVANLSSEGYAAEMKEMLSLL